MALRPDQTLTIEITIATDLSLIKQSIWNAIIAHMFFYLNKGQIYPFH